MVTKEPGPRVAPEPVQDEPAAEASGADGLGGLQPLLAEALGSAVRRLIRRSRSEFEKAARSSKTRLELRQMQKDLDHFWVRLGKTAYHLVRAGELDHSDLRRAMARIDELEAKIDDLRRRRPDLIEESEG